jgi:hypothetical protein
LLHFIALAQDSVFGLMTVVPPLQSADQNAICTDLSLVLLYHHSYILPRLPLGVIDGGRRLVDINFIAIKKLLRPESGLEETSWEYPATSTANLNCVINQTGRQPGVSGILVYLDSFTFGIRDLAVKMRAAELVMSD